MKFFWSVLLLASAGWAQTAPTFPGAQALDDAINQAIKDNKMPGAVVLIGHDGQVVYRKAYGNRALAPRVEPMTTDTIFDCASLTKVVATTTSMMQLLEQGKYRLNDKITDYIPEFPGRQKRRHHPKSPHPLLGPAARRGAEARVEGLRDRHAARVHVQARGPALHALPSIATSTFFSSASSCTSSADSSCPITQSSTCSFRSA